MNKNDLSIYEYRRQKDILNYEYVMNERLYGKFQKFSIRTIEAGYVDCYLYLPENFKHDQQLPIVINLHGGGFVLGYPEQDGIYCQNIANELNCAVINIDYCLAPEFKFPKAIYSTYEVISVIKSKAQDYSLDSNNITMMGHSAGGSIAAGLTLLDKEKKEINFAGIILNYAALDQEETLTLTENPKQSISSSRMQQYFNWYFRDEEDAKNPLASPINGDLSNLPRIFIIAAEYDHLKVKEKEFYNKAKACGSEVIYKEFKDCGHGFTHKWFKEYNPKQSKIAWKDISQFIYESQIKKGIK